MSTPFFGANTSPRTASSEKIQVVNKSWVVHHRQRVFPIFHNDVHNLSSFRFGLSSRGKPSSRSGRCILCSAMSPSTVIDSRQEILRVAARLFQQQGYHATSMNDVAAALKLSKGGLYHHFQSKDEILFNLMDHAMTITEESVLKPVMAIPDPEQALRTLIRLHIEVVLSWRDREITVMLHENHPLPPVLRRRINARK